MTPDILWEIAFVAIALAMGGILKGATGAGAPILAIPVLALLFDVRFAIVVMMVPNLLTNIWQTWKFRSHLPGRSFIAPLLIGGIFGVLVGTFTLASLSSDTLTLFVAFAVIGYITLRLARPDWTLSMDVATKIALPVGIAAGFLQGASGLSAPVSITFLNAMRLARPVFIATISLFFAIFTLFQFSALAFSGLIHLNELAISAFALMPITLAMPVGARLAKTLNPKVFDTLILGLLGLIALRLLFNSFL